MIAVVRRWRDWPAGRQRTNRNRNSDLTSRRPTQAVSPELQLHRTATDRHCAAATEVAPEKYSWNERVCSSVAGEGSAAASHASPHLAVAIVGAGSGTGTIVDGLIRIEQFLTPVYNTITQQAASAYSHADET